MKLSGSSCRPVHPLPRAVRDCSAEASLGLASDPCHVMDLGQCMPAVLHLWPRICLPAASPVPSGKIHQTDSASDARYYARCTCHQHPRAFPCKQALDRFAKGDLSVLVASDVAARGLDIKDVRRVTYDPT